VSILDVVNAVEPIPRIRGCPLGLESHTSLCPLHRELDEACAATERAFARVSIAGLLNQPAGVPPLCEVGQTGACAEASRCRHERIGPRQRSTGEKEGTVTP
jgi:hypothetical protein